MADMFIDPLCGGLLPLLGDLETQAALSDDASPVVLTRDDLRNRALRLAANLVATDKKLVFLFADNTCGTVIAFLACVAAGHVVALLDPALAADRLSALMSAYEPDILISTGPLAQIDSVVVDGRWSCSMRGDVQVCQRTTALPDQAAGIDPSVAVLLSTSGSTGSPKFVRLSAANLVENARQVVESLAITSGSVGVGHLPFHYSYGLSVVTSHLMAGGRMFMMMDAMTSPTFWPKIADAGGTHVPGVPFHHSVLARFGFALMPPSVSVLTQAGGALDLRLQRVIHEKASARACRFYVMYGQTEASPRIAVLDHDDFAEKMGSVGRVLARGALSIVDPVSGALKATGEMGAVVYAGGNVMLGYATCRQDLSAGDLLRGVLVTADLGRLDADGFLFLTGRATRFAKIAGLRISLDDIEAQAAAVCAVGCVDMGEKVLVFHDEAFGPALKERMRQLASEYKIPPQALALRPLPDLPRLPSGKIDYAALKAVADVR